MLPSQRARCLSYRPVLTQLFWPARRKYFWRAEARDERARAARRDCISFLASALKLYEKIPCLRDLLRLCWDPSPRGPRKGGA